VLRCTGERAPVAVSPVAGGTGTLGLVAAGAVIAGGEADWVAAIVGAEPVSGVLVVVVVRE